MHGLTQRQRKCINTGKAVSFDSNVIFYHKQKQPSNPEGLLLEPYTKETNLVVGEKFNHLRDLILLDFGIVVFFPLISSEMTSVLITVCNVSACSSKHCTA